MTTDETLDLLEEAAASNVTARALAQSKLTILQQREQLEAWRSWAHQITGVDDETDEELRELVWGYLADARAWAVSVMVDGGAS